MMDFPLRSDSRLRVSPTQTIPTHKWTQEEHQFLHSPHEEAAIYWVDTEQDIGVVVPVSQQSLDLSVQRVSSLTLLNAK